MDTLPANRAGFGLSVAVVGVGLVASVVGLLTAAGYAAAMAGHGAGSPGADRYLEARAILILVESVLCLVFALIGGLCLALRRFPAAMRVTAAAAAALKIVLLAGLLSTHWKTGWSAILSPDSPTPWAQVLLIFSALQALPLIALGALGWRQRKGEGEGTPAAPPLRKRDTSPR